MPRVAIFRSSKIWGGNLSFGDDDLVYLKDYIESGKSQLKKEKPKLLR